MHKENDTWGAPRIHGELLRLDFKVSEATVSRYRVRLGPRRPKLHSNQSWATFLRNHVPEFSAMDFFTVYDIFFRRHYVFFVLDHEYRKIRHFAVTTRPTGAWVLQQLREAFPYDSGQADASSATPIPSSLLPSAISSPMSASSSIGFEANPG